MDTEFEESSVAVFHLPPIDDPKCTNLKNWKIPKFEELDTLLCNTKSLIDAPYAKSATQWDNVTKKYEPSYHIAKRLKVYIPIVTNAGSKIYELMHCFHKYIFHKDMKTIVHFDNASMPGIFPYTVNYYVQAFAPTVKYDWYASSLIESNELDKSPLRDDYSLWKNYPNRWLMDEKHNGDVMDPDVQAYFKKRLGGKVDLYTSDIGFDVSRDYNAQETLQSPANLGQILSGLVTLKKGGVMMTKQFTYMHCFTISLMGLITRLFDKVYITKPTTSKPDNSETYLVGVGYKGFNATVIDALTKHLADANVIIDDKIVPMKPLIQKGCISNAFIKALTESNIHFTNSTVAKIRQNLDDFAKRVPGEHNKNPARRLEMDETVDNWFVANPVKHIRPEQQLKSQHYQQKKYRPGKNRRRSKK